MKKIIVFCAIISSIGLGGCAALMSHKHQKITIVSTTPGATISYRDHEIGTGSAKVRLLKRKVFHEFKVEKDGYKTTTYVTGLGKRGPSIAWAVVDLVPLVGWMGFFALDNHAPGTFRYKKVQNVPALTKYEPRHNEKFLRMDKTTFDVARKDIVIAKYKGLKSFYHATASKNASISRRVKKNTKSKAGTDLRVDNTLFNKDLNGILKKMNFVDTTFLGTKNALVLNATVKKIKMHVIKYYDINIMPNVNPNSVVCAELDIDWTLTNAYDEKLYTTHTKKMSDLFG